MTLRLRGECRLCGGPLELLLDYGLAPLANALRASAEEPEQRAPLSLRSCTGCGLVQVPEVIDPALLFANYPYRTGTSRTMRAHLGDLAAELAGRHPGGRVLEIGCNDGSLLEAMTERGLSAMGVDPAQQAAEEARLAGHRVRTALFDDVSVEAIGREDGRFDCVVGTNVLAHVDEPVELLRRAARLLRPGGQLVFEVPSLQDFLDAGAIDTVYHEHLCVFSRTSLLRLAQAAGLGVLAFQPQTIHGGSLRLVLAPGAHSPLALRQAEAEAPRVSRRRLRALPRRAELLRERLRRALDPTRQAGGVMVGYGASAKGVMLLHLCGIDDLACVLDANPSKQGRLLPVGRAPILPPEALRERPADLVLLLAWNLAAEVRAQLVGLAPELLVPLPRLTRHVLASTTGAPTR